MTKKSKLVFSSIFYPCPKGRNRGKSGSPARKSFRRALGYRGKTDFPSEQWKYFCHVLNNFIDKPEEIINQINSIQDETTFLKA